MKKFYGFLLAGLGLFLIALPLSAHHSIWSVFDGERDAIITGTITEVRWINPHVYWMVDVENEATGQIEQWRIESSNPVEFRSAGVSRAMAGKPGEVVRSCVYLARDGTAHLGFGLWFEFPSDGRKIVTRFDIRSGAFERSCQEAGSD